MGGSPPRARAARATRSTIHAGRRRWRNKADAMEDKADAIHNQADQVRQWGKDEKKSVDRAERAGAGVDETVVNKM